MSSDPIRAALEASREELLDLGLQNPLLNLRPSRTRSVAVTDERSVEVYRILVTAGRAMDFLPAPDGAGGGGLPQPEDGARYVDGHLQTPHGSVQLQQRLLNVAQDARTLLEEQGVNVCSLALGMLHWREGPAGVPLVAPLLLVPVTLTRDNARSRFVVRHSGEDVGLNLSLAARLRADFGLELPEAPGEERDAEAFFAAVEAAVAAGHPEWRVARDEMLLGLFSFGRFLLYRDLDEAAWPADQAPCWHPVVRALLGEGFVAPPAGAPPPSGVEIMDADGSQAAALAEAAAGRHLVIQGPPGTGKSQTIANLIAQAVAAGQRVLFVAEKMAALEVVKRRLDGVGLGDLCLELHSHKSHKRGVLAELERTLALGRPELPAEGPLTELARLRERLDGYRAAVTEPVGPSGVSPFEAIGELRRIAAGDRLPRLAFTPMTAWDRATFQARVALVEELQARRATLGVPAEHPFAGAGCTRLLPTDAEALDAALDAAAAALQTARSAAAALAGTLRLPAPEDAAGLPPLLAAAHALEAAPDIAGVEPRSADWRRRAADLGRTLDLVAEMTETVRAQPAVLAEAWEGDLLATAPQLVECRQDLATYGPKWWRVFSGRYRAARRRLALLCSDLPAGLEAMLAMLDALLAVRRRQQDLKPLEPLAASLFRTRWGGWRGETVPLRAIAAWLQGVHERTEAGDLPPGLLARLPDPWDAAAVAAARTAAERALAALVERLGAVEAALAWTAAPLRDLAFAECAARLRRWRAHLPELRALTAYNDLAARCRAAGGLDDLLTLAHAWPEGGQRLADALRAAWYGGLVATAEAERPALGEFDRDRHEHVRDRFRALDVEAFAHHRARVARQHFDGLPTGGPGLARVRREIEKRARHLPIRQLLLEAGDAVQAIKPVFMMSPLSIATYLAPAGPRFDLVVFDEASQVRPVDALGAIARGRQVVVVGDSRQMPPTRFFERLVDSEDLDDERNVTADLESILGLFSAAGAPARMLSWHYRSRHPSLIAVSNHLFYGDGLVLFPSPVRAVSGEAPGETDALGLELRLVPDAVYDRGGARTNDGEARAIAEAVLRHARVAARHSIGVVAFSTPQMEAIVEHVERLRREHPETERFFAAHPHEPFFVKNLENVQGDERDVILISVGYGRGPDGRIYQNFGPLNAQGGERRLNVLITRARRRCEVFTHLEPEDIDLSRTQAEGVRALRTFLKYARDGHLDVATTHGDAASPLEHALQDALTARGHAVHRRVGADGFHVDLGVVDPDDPDRYLLGVECDGATFQRSRSTRERERLRQAVLTGLGWHLHRVWSAALHRDAEGEVARIEEALEAARAAAAPPAPAAAEPPTFARAEGIDPDAITRKLILPTVGAYPRWSGRLESVPGAEAELEAWLRTTVLDIVRTEGPLTWFHASRRVREAMSGSEAAGSFNVNQAVQAAAEAARKDGELEIRGWFLWPAGLSEAPQRDRSALSRSERTTATVPREEIERTLSLALAAAQVAELDTVLVACARQLGLPRGEVTQEPGRRTWQAALDRLLAAGQVRRHRELLVWAGPPPTAS